MLFILIKNEFIKLLSKAKTWIVFGLFIVFIGLNIFSQYKSDKIQREYNSPEFKLQMYKENLDYTNDEIKAANEEVKINPEYVEHLAERKEELEANIIMYEDVIKNGGEEDLWKATLDEDIKNHEASIKNLAEYEDEWSAKYMLQAEGELEQLKYLRDNNIEPVYDWEYQAYGFMQNLMEFLGMAILLCGVAVFMGDIVSGECTPATLKFLLVQPVTRGKVLLSKFIAVVITVLAMILGAETLGILFVKLTGTVDGGSYPVRIGALFETIVNSDGSTALSAIAGSGYMGTNSELLIKSMLFQGLFILTGCAVVFMISTLIKSSMITMAVSVMSTVFITIASLSVSALRSVTHLMFVNYADTMRVLTGGAVMKFENANMTINNGIIVMVVTTVIAYAIAHINFSKKDILI